MNLRENTAGAGSIVFPPKTAPAGWFTRAALLLILAFTYFLYSPATSFEFVYDDIFQIVQNNHLDSWHFLPVYFTQHVWSHLPQVPANFYRPLFLLWLRLNNILFNHEPTGWHLTTILLHLGMTGLTYLLGVRLLKQRTAALLAALMFGVHPVHLEAVAWVSGVAEPLSGIFFLGSLLCYFRARGERRAIGWTAASLLLFAASLLAKETAAVLPLILLTYEFTLGRTTADAHEARGAVQRLTRRLIPYFAALAVYLCVRAWVLRQLTHRMSHVPLYTSLLTWPWLVCLYLRQLFWPFRLSPLCDPSFVTSPGQLKFVLPLLFLLAAALALWLSRGHKPALPAFLSLWFAITLAPALLIFCVALPAEGFHDRYLYLPSLAFALAIGAIFAAISAKAQPAAKFAALPCVAVVATVFAVATHRQLSYWQNNYALFQRAAAIAPRNEMANLNFATQLIKTGQYAQALRYARQAVADNPQSAPAQASAGSAAYFLKDYPQAAQFYESAIRLGPPQADWYYSLGLSRLNSGNFEAATNALQQAVAENPKARGVHYALGLADSHLGEWQEAITSFAAELSLDSSNQAAQAGLKDAKAHLESLEAVSHSSHRRDAGLLHSSFPQSKNRSQKLSK